MTDKEYIAELEEKEKFFDQQINLRDKLIIRLLAEAEPLCEECALKIVCTNGAKYETCARGLLVAMLKSESDERTPENYITLTHK